jgi:hypothetical protein
VATPWQSQFPRYLAPITPLTLLFLLVALIAIRDWLKRLTWGHIAGVLAMTVPLVGILLVQIVVAPHLLKVVYGARYYDAVERRQVFRPIQSGNAWQALDHAFEWIRNNAAADAVIATTVPHLAYLRARHKAVLPPFVRDPNTARHLLDEVPVSYLVIDRFRLPGVSERYAAPVVAHNVGDWRLVFTAPDRKTCVYERTH